MAAQMRKRCHALICGFCGFVKSTPDNREIKCRFRSMCTTVTNVEGINRSTRNSHPVDAFSKCLWAPVLLSREEMLEDSPPLILAFIERHKFCLIRASVIRLWTDQAIIVDLFQNMGGPTGGTADCERGSKEIARQANEGEQSG